MRKTALYRGFSIPKILFIVLSWSAEEVRTALGAWLTSCLLSAPVREASLFLVEVTTLIPQCHRQGENVLVF